MGHTQILLKASKSRWDHLCYLLTQPPELFPPLPLGNGDKATGHNWSSLTQSFRSVDRGKGSEPNVCIWFCPDTSVHFSQGLSSLMQRMGRRHSLEQMGIFDMLVCSQGPENHAWCTVDTASSPSRPSVFGSVVWGCREITERVMTSSELTTRLPTPVGLRPAGSTVQ